MHHPTLSAALLSLIVALAPTPAAAFSTLDCKKIRVDEQNFDLSKLGGAHSMVTTKYEASADAHTNTTYTLDVCYPLKKTGDAKKTEQCPNGTKGMYEVKEQNLGREKKPRQN